MSGPIETAVLVVGAGPVGLSLALGLARRGVRSILVEKKAALSEHSKAPGILPRTMEIFQQWGVAETILSRAIMHGRPTAYDARTGKPLVTLPLDELAADTRFAGICILEQAATERVLLEALQQTGLCDVRFGCELTDFQIVGGGCIAHVRLPDGEQDRIACRFLAGCDGASSRVRELLRLGFEGITYPVDAILADVRFADERAELPSPRLLASGRRASLLIRLESGAWRIVSIIPDDPPDRHAAKGEVSPELVTAIVEEAFGSGPFHQIWSSHFALQCRTADSFRAGPVLLAGDAAHVNSPAGAQGMNSGIQDAHNLAWKLGMACAGGDEDRLLNSYATERRGVARDVQRLAHRLTRTALAPPWLRRLMQPVGLAGLRLPRLRRYLMRTMAMLDWRYNQSGMISSGPGTGRRLPDVELRGPAGTCRVHDIMGEAPMMLCLGRTAPAIPATLRELLIVVEVRTGMWHDPDGALARIFGTDTVLIVRPDHYVGWNGVPADEADLLQQARRVLGFSYA